MVEGSPSVPPFEPYFRAWYMLPVRTNGRPFQNLGPNHPRSKVRNIGAARPVSGVEQIAWEKPSTAQRVTVSRCACAGTSLLRARSHSELREALSGSPPVRETTPPKSAATPAPRRPFVNRLRCRDSRHPTLASPDPGVLGPSAATPASTSGRPLNARFPRAFGMRRSTRRTLVTSRTGVDQQQRDRRSQRTRTEKNPALSPTHRQTPAAAAAFEVNSGVVAVLEGHR